MVLRVLRNIFFVFAMLAAVIPLASVGQRQAPVSGVQTELPGPQRDSDRTLAEMEQRRLREANKERYEELKRDADKLLQVATELKLYVDQSNENVLSLTVIRKAEEMERLAKSVKQKMRGN